MEVHEPPSTYAEYNLLPADAPRYEILRGVGYLTPAPGTRHQMISANLEQLLYQYVRGHGLGSVYHAPLDVVLSETDVVQPDVIYIARERYGIIKSRGIFGVPDMVIEILSPASMQRDCQQKLALYTRSGISEYWIVGEENRSVDIWTSAETALDTRRVATGETLIQSQVMPGLQVSPAQLFAGIDEIPL